MHNGDCLEVMRGIADGSVDAIITDPPYYSTNLHFDKSDRIDFDLWLKECQRILKPTGILIAFADFNLLADLRQKSPFKSTYELIWEKTMPQGVLDANCRPLRNHEFIGIFTDAFKASTYNPQKWDSGIKQETKGGGKQAHYGGRERTAYKSDGERHPLSVLKFSNGNNGSLHPTQKPLDLVSWLMRTYSNEGDLIFDPFMGSGTTGHAASLLNRRFIGCELDNAYYSIAKARIENAQHDLVNYFGEVA